MEKCIHDKFRTILENNYNSDLIFMLKTLIFESTSLNVLFLLKDFRSEINDPYEKMELILYGTFYSKRPFGSYCDKNKPYENFKIIVSLIINEICNINNEKYYRDLINLMSDIKTKINKSYLIECMYNMVNDSYLEYMYKIDNKIMKKLYVEREL